jgi:hypothetical protein
MGLNDAELAAGYEAQPVGVFHDQLERHAFELCYVYGPPSQTDARGPVCALDEGRSYWRVSCLGTNDEERNRSPEECLTFTQAQQRFPGKLKFKRFSSVEVMRDSLPAIMFPH